MMSKTLRWALRAAIAAACDDVEESSRAFGTVFLTCLMDTGPVAGVGFSLMAGSIAPSPHVRKGNFGKVVPLLMKKPGRMRVEKSVFWRMGLICVTRGGGI